jgi:hypothetical protein
MDDGNDARFLRKTIDPFSQSEAAFRCSRMNKSPPSILQTEASQSALAEKQQKKKHQQHEITRFILI